MGTITGLKSMHSALLRLKQARLDFWRGQSPLAPAKRRGMASVEHFPKVSRAKSSHTASEIRPAFLKKEKLGIR